MTKWHIIDEIRRTAQNNGGVPLGERRFLKETGIRESDWLFTYFTCRLTIEDGMKQNITLAIDRKLLKRARALAAQRGTSVSGLLSAELQKLVQNDEKYQQAKTKALAFLASPPFRLGGKGIGNREALHDRENLR